MTIRLRRLMRSATAPAIGPKIDRGKRKGQDDEADGGIGLRDVMVIDRLAHPQQEREVDHAVGCLRDSLGEPEPQKGKVAKDRPKRTVLLRTQHPAWPRSFRPGCYHGRRTRIDRYVTAAAQSRTSPPSGCLC